MGYSADIAASGGFDALVVRGARFQLAGRLVGAGSGARFDLSDCGPVGARRLAFDSNPVDAFAARLCPGAGPLVLVDARGWRTAGRLANASGDIASAAIVLRAAEGAFEASGAATGLERAALVLDRGVISDTTAPIRFRAVDAAGRADLAGGVWTGAFTADTRAGHRIGRIAIRHDVASGAGRADIDAGGLAFAPTALQPGDLTPMANFAREADGRAGFNGWFTWGADGHTASGGDLIARSLTFKSPLGRVVGIDADLHFVSLAPLVSAPDQRIEVGRVEAITPLSGVRVQFELSADQLSLKSASGSFAEGRISLEPVVAPLAAGSTIQAVLVLDHVDLGEIIAVSSLADAVKLDAVVDGRVPFTIGPSGLTIQHGHIGAIAPGRLSISRQALAGGVGARAPAAPSPAAPRQAGFAEDLAYQAMENLAFDQLDASVDSLPGDRLGTLFHIKGRHDPPQVQRARIAVTDLISGHALDKPLTLPSDTRIDLTLDTTLNFGEIVRAIGQTWRDSLGDGGEARRPGPAEPPASSMTIK